MRCHTRESGQLGSGIQRCFSFLPHGADRIKDEGHRRLGKLPGRFAIGILDNAERVGRRGNSLLVNKQRVGVAPVQRGIHD
ncbi:unannotated protein [freshwater metagenome]|uniref:Unannotated protein n=1 Tax=freshwater metagenome TaxID=449393 RepID=A0A6J6X4Q2_9ZZZZ